MKNNLKNEVINKMVEKLHEYEDCKFYGCDFGYGLFEGENVDGSFTYNTHEAKEWIKTYFDDIGEVWEELQFEFDKDFLSQYNPFNEPEKFSVLILLEVSSYLSGKCKTIEENWDNELILNKKTIKKIEKELKELNDGGCIYE